MRNHVTFRTLLFNSETVKDDYINDCCFGDDCAKWLIERLCQEPGLRVDPEPVQEDWGWVFFVRTASFRFWVGVGLDPDDAQPPRWLAHVNRAGWLFSRARRTAAAEDRRAVCAALDCALRSSAEVADIRWYHETEFVAGRDTDSADRPDVP